MVSLEDWNIKLVSNVSLDWREMGQERYKNNIPKTKESEWNEHRQ